MTTKKKNKKMVGHKAVSRKSKKAVHKASSHTSREAAHKPVHQASKPASLQAHKPGAAQAHKAKGTEPEFQYIPVTSIEVTEQVRSNINTDSDSFKALMQSIKDRGILEPLLVTGQDGGSYTLLCGERRLVAAQQLGMETVPVRVVDGATEQDEIIAFQLIENLQREDLNPIDQAQGILSYIQIKLPNKKYDVNSLMSDLVSYDRRPEDISQEFADTVSAIVQIAGKTTRTLLRTISLLTNPPDIQAAISE